MPRVSHHFVADRPVDAVFDVVTTARYWTEWHPATRGIEGDGTRFQRDLDFPELGPQVTAAMAAQSQAGVANLAALVERQIPA